MNSVFGPITDPTESETHLSARRLAAVADEIQAKLDEYERVGAPGSYELRASLRTVIADYRRRSDQAYILARLEALEAHVGMNPKAVAE